MRTIHIGDGTGTGSYARVEIPDDAAEKLVASGLLYDCGDDPGDHDLHINPEYQGTLSSIETLVLGIARAQSKTFTIGDATMRHVFEPAGLRNMSDMQAVMDEVERVCAAYEKSNDSRLETPAGMVSITTNGTTRLIPEDEPVFLLRAQDKFAADTVRFWTGMVEGDGDAAIVEEATRHADKMDAWSKKKVPDLPGRRVQIDEHLPANNGKWTAPDASKLRRVEKLREDAKEAYRPSEEGDHKGLPVAGYKPTQPQNAIDAVNRFKAFEERVLREIEALENHGGDAISIDSRFMAIGKTQLQMAFMAINRAVFQPGRVKLPEDEA